MIYVKNTLLLFLILLFSNCVLMEGAGRVLDGSVFAEKNLAIYRANVINGISSELELFIVKNKNDEQSMIITIKKFPMIKIRSSMPDDDGVFHLLSFDYLSGSTHGWNEYSMQMAGSGRLILKNNAVLEKIEEIEPIQITNGRIQRYDTRITGKDAVSALRNRNERISALTEWMITANAPKGQEINEFEKYWKPVLFPEMVSEKDKPKGWNQPGDKKQKTEDINWNTSYTERVFPEEFHLVRNSGTLLRDWEEALYWIYFMYEWESIKEMFTQEIIFQKIK